MPDHSFEAPLLMNQITENWSLQATTIPEDKVIINPSVVDRFGMMWNKKPIDSEKFDLVYEFRVDGSMGKGQGLAFWYVQENFSENFHIEDIYSAESWNAGMEAAGLDYFGYRKKFEGLGIIFENNKISCSTDGNPQVAPQFDFENLPKGKKLKLWISVKGLGKWTSVNLKTTDKEDTWKTVCTIPPLTFRMGSLGITSYTGSTHPPAFITLDALQATNKDPRHAGEVPFQTQFKDLQTTIYDASRIANQRELGDVLKKYIDATEFFSQYSRDTLGTVQHEADSAIFGLKQLEYKARLFSSKLKLTENGSPGVDELKHHISGLRSLLHAEKKKVDSKTQKLADNMKQVGFDKEHVLREMGQKTVELQKKTSSTGSMFYLFVFVLIAVAIIVLLLYQKMDTYERKHFL